MFYKMIYLNIYMTAFWKVSPDANYKLKASILVSFYEYFKNDFELLYIYILCFKYLNVAVQ